MTTPEHVENTGDNLRRAADVQQEAKDEDTSTQVSDDQPSVEVPLPDFNS